MPLCYYWNVCFILFYYLHLNLRCWQIHFICLKCQNLVFKLGNITLALFYQIWSSFQLRHFYQHLISSTKKKKKRSHSLRKLESMSWNVSSACSALTFNFCWNYLSFIEDPDMFSLMTISLVIFQHEMFVCLCILVSVF